MTSATNNQKDILWLTASALENDGLSIRPRSFVHLDVIIRGITKLVSGKPTEEALNVKLPRTAQSMDTCEDPFFDRHHLYKRCTEGLFPRDIEAHQRHHACEAIDVHAQHLKRQAVGNDTLTVVANWMLMVHLCLEHMVPADELDAHDNLADLHAEIRQELMLTTGCHPTPITYN